MSSSIYFVGSPFVITQNGQFHTKNLNDNPIPSSYDYILDINLQTAYSYTMNDLFNSRTYRQNTENENDYDINIQVNLDLINYLLYAVNSVDIKTNAPSVGLNPAYETINKNVDRLFGLRMLEIVAVKIFGHAKARAAIANDSDFYLPVNDNRSLIKQLANGIDGSINNRKNDIFKTYITRDKIQQNPQDDVTNNANFNFKNTAWEFPVYFISTLSHANNVNTDKLRNGPDVGGSRLTNGIMNIPLLLRFHDGIRSNADQNLNNEIVIVNDIIDLPNIEEEAFIASNPNVSEPVLAEGFGTVIVSFDTNSVDLYNSGSNARAFSFLDNQPNIFARAGEVPQNILYLPGLNISTPSTFSDGITLSSTLSVSGNSLFNNDVSVRTLLYVSGTTTFLSDINFTSNTNFYKYFSGNSNLNVQGIGYYLQNLNISGATSFYAGVSANSDFTVNQNVTTASNVTINNNSIHSNSMSILSSLNVDGMTYIEGLLKVSGQTIMNNKTYLRANLNVLGSVTLNSDLQVNNIITDTMNINTINNLNNISINNFSVSGNTKITSSTSFISNLNVSGISTFNNPIKLPVVTQTYRDTNNINGSILLNSDNNKLNINSNSGWVDSGVSIENTITGRTSFGYQAASSGQLFGAIAIGYQAGQTNQGSNSIAIGYQAGQTNLPNNTIVINANNAPLNVAKQNGLYINPIRRATTNSMLYYNNSSKEISYGPKLSGSSSTASTSIFSLSVSGLTTIRESMSVRSSLLVSGSTTIYGTVSIASALMVSSTSVLQNLQVNTTSFSRILGGSVTINSTLRSGNMTIASNLKVSNNTIIIGPVKTTNINISGSTSILSNLYSLSNGYLNTNLSIGSSLFVTSASASIINNNLIVSDKLISTGNITVLSDFRFNNLTLNILPTINTSFNITGHSIIDGSLTTNSMNVTASTNIYSFLTVSGTTNSFRDFGVNEIFISGKTTFNNLFNIPNMTQSQIDSIVNVEKGMIVFNNTIKRLILFNGTSWVEDGVYIDSSLYTVSAGYLAGTTNQGTGASAIGYNAGNTNQGLYSIAIGYNAAPTNQPNNTIVLNASSTPLNVTTSNAFYVSSINNGESNSFLYYNPTTKELTYGSPAESKTINNLTVSTTSNFIQQVSMLSDLYVSNNTSFGGYLSIGTTLNVSNTSILQNLFVSSNTTMYNVSSNTIFISSQSNLGFINLSGLTTITSNTTLLTSLPLNITTNQINIVGNLYGSITNGTSVNVSGNATFGTLSLSNTNTSVIQRFNNLTTICGTITNSKNDAYGYFATSFTNLDTINVSANAIFYKNINIFGTTSALSNISGTVGSNLFHNSSTILSNLVVSGTTNFNNVIRLPIMNQTQIDLTTSNTSGHMLYNDTTNMLNIFNGSSWTQFGVKSDFSITGRTSIGYLAGANQQAGAIAIGYQAGQTNQGENSIAIGYNAGSINQPNNSIVLNATGSELNVLNTDSLNIKPIRNINSLSILHYNSDTKEITYNSPGVNTNNVFNELNISNYTILQGSVSSMSQLNISGNSIFNDVKLNNKLIYNDNKEQETAYTNLNTYEPARETLAYWTTQTFSFAPEDVCWSPELGIYCVIGDSRYAISLDGIIWTTGINSNLASFNKICWASYLGIFCAANNNGIAAISYDGIIWSTTLIGTSASLNSISWSPDLKIFCATGSTYVFTSSDGISWTTNTYSGSGYSLRNVIWSKELGKFIGTRNATPRIMASTNGSSWSGFTLGAANDTINWWSIAWSPELQILVSVAFDGSIIRSSDNGTTWTSVYNLNEMSTQVGGGIIWSSEVGLFYIAMGNYLMISNNGTTWENIRLESSIFTNNVTKICWSPELGKTLILSQTNSNRCFIQSFPFNNKFYSKSVHLTKLTDNLNVNDSIKFSDGTIQNVPYLDNMYSNYFNKWTTRTAVVENDWSSICWSPELNLFCAVSISGTGNRIMTSSDSINWTTRSNPVDNNWTSICWAPKLRIFCAVANSGTGNRIMTSFDGITWITRINPIDNDWSSICWSEELCLFCSVAATGTLASSKIMTSTDGITWVTNASSTNIDSNYKSICWSNTLGLFCATGASPVYKISISPDGINWTNINSDVHVKSVCWSEELSLFCGVGIQTSVAGKCVISSDGINWTTQSLDQTYNWQSVVWANNLKIFVAVSDSNRMSYSYDGKSWTSVTTPTLTTGGSRSDLKSICYSKELDLLVTVVSNNINVLTSEYYSDYPVFLKYKTNSMGIAVNPVSVIDNLTNNIRLKLSTDTARKLTTTTWTAISDQRVKKDIVDADINQCYNINKNLKLRYFEWDDQYGNIDDRHSIGFIAQEVKEYFPKSITYSNYPFKYTENITKTIESEIPIYDENNEIIRYDKVINIQEIEESKDNINDFHILNCDHLFNLMWGTQQKLINKIEDLKTNINIIKNHINQLKSN